MMDIDDDANHELKDEKKKEKNGPDLDDLIDALDSGDNRIKRPEQAARLLWTAISHNAQDAIDFFSCPKRPERKTKFLSELKPSKTKRAVAEKWAKHIAQLSKADKIDPPLQNPAVEESDDGDEGLWVPNPDMQCGRCKRKKVVETQTQRRRRDDEPRRVIARCTACPADTPTWPLS